MISPAINNKLGKITRKKLKVNVLISVQMQNRKTNARKLFDTMALDNVEYMVTLDEAIMYLVLENWHTDHCYLKRGTQSPDDCIIASKENFH